MKSNGYGSFQQVITISVTRKWADTIAQIPFMTPLQIDDDPERAFFEWRHWCIRQRDDENVVWYLTLALPDDEDCDWKIHWNRTVY
jgi:hypothetical protein